MLPVFVQRRGTNTLDLAAREWWLQNVGGINRSLCRARTNERVQLINKEDRIARRAQLFKNLLQPLFKLSAVLGSSNE